jgi:hypothetical protein
MARNLLALSALFNCAVAISAAFGASAANCNMGDHGGTITTRYNMPNATPASTEYVNYVNNVWVLELNPTASAAVYLDYLGGSSPGGTFSPDTSVAGIQVDSSGLTYVAGTTEATNFQATANAYQSSARLAGITNSTTATEQSDGFITVISAGGGSVTYSTYLNGTMVSPAGAAFITKFSSTGAMLYSAFFWRW